MALVPLRILADHERRVLGPVGVGEGSTLAERRGTLVMAPVGFTAAADLPACASLVGLNSAEDYVRGAKCADANCEASSPNETLKVFGRFAFHVLPPFVLGSCGFHVVTNDISRPPSR